ncbi:hypothetical protein FOZ63_014625, partial [Perkinsus olseni]
QLLWAGCDRDIVNKNGDTALHVAAKGGYEDIVWLLCENGAEGSYTVKNNDGKQAIDLAREAGHTDTVELLEKEMGSDGKPIEHQRVSPGDRRDVPSFALGVSALACMSLWGLTSEGVCCEERSSFESSTAASTVSRDRACQDIINSLTSEGAEVHPSLTIVERGPKGTSLPHLELEAVVGMGLVASH